MPYAESRERFAEVLEIIKRAWTRGTFSYHGKFYHFDDLTWCRSRIRSPIPDIRIAANSPDTFAGIGAIGYADLLSPCGSGRLSELGPLLRAYRDAWRAPPAIPATARSSCACPSMSRRPENQARDEPEDSIMHFYRVLGAQLEQSAGSSGARAIEQRARNAARNCKASTTTRCSRENHRRHTADGHRPLGGTS